MAALSSAGKRNRRIVIKALAPGEDALGQPLTTWSSTVATLWAEILPRPAASAGAESVQAGKEVSQAVYTFRVGYTTSITPAMRVEHGGQIFSIVSVSPDYAGRQRTDIVAVAGVS